MTVKSSKTVKALVLMVFSLQRLGSIYLDLVQRKSGTERMCDGVNVYVLRSIELFITLDTSESSEEEQALLILDNSPI